MKKVISIFLLVGFLVSCNTIKNNQNSPSQTIQKAKTPDAIVTFYDKVLNDPGVGGQSLELIKKGLSDDWNTRPNPLNPTSGIGPNPEGVKQILGLWALIVPDLYVERQKTIVSGNTITVLSKIGGTINKNLPAEMKEIPFFPGIPAEKIKGKSFETMALDIQVLNNEGKIFRTWHMEDWASAQAQLVHGIESINFGFDKDFVGKPIVFSTSYNEVTGKDVPEAIVTFYDKILNHSATKGQDIEIIKSAVVDQWQSRPNGLDPTGKSGPNANGIPKIMGFWNLLLEDIHIERKKNFMVNNVVVVLSAFGAKVKSELPEEFDELPMFAGIPAKDIKGKSFETMALDVHILNGEGKITKTWHMEDWASAQEQLVNGSPVQDFGFSKSYLDLSTTNQELNN